MQKIRAELKWFRIDRDREGLWRTAQHYTLTKFCFSKGTKKETNKQTKNNIWVFPHQGNWNKTIFIRKHTRSTFEGICVYIICFLRVLMGAIRTVFFADLVHLCTCFTQIYSLFIFYFYKEPSIYLELEVLV